MLMLVLRLESVNVRPMASTKTIQRTFGMNLSGYIETELAAKWYLIISVMRQLNSDLTVCC